MSEKILADRYRLVEQIGMGGMAIVYRAIDMRTGHNVAVKVLRPEFNQDAEFVGRFQREAEAASKMTHHNIVNLLDVGMDGENRYLVMEYVQGKTLKELIQEKGRLNPQVAAQVTIRILSALQHAHQNGIIHRDIKPQNILVNADGHVKVADFGIARMADSSTLTRGDSVMGSVHYFSPEQASGQAADARSDIYSCGVVLYEMLTGRVPFDGDSPVAVAMQHLHAKPAPIESIAPDVPQAISHVCMMAMEKNPKYRYQSAMEMAAELRLALEGRTERMQPRLVEAMPIPAPPRPPQRPVGMDTASQARKVPPRRRYQVHPHRTGMWTLLSLIMAGLVFYGLYLGGGAIYERVVTSTTVPDLLGSDVVTAQRLASRANLQLEVIEVNHPTVPAGTVILQAPEMDTTLKRGHGGHHRVEGTFGPAGARHYRLHHRGRHSQASGRRPHPGRGGKSGVRPARGYHSHPDPRRGQHLRFRGHCAGDRLRGQRVYSQPGGQNPPGSPGAALQRQADPEHTDPVRGLRRGQPARQGGAAIPRGGNPGNRRHRGDPVGLPGGQPGARRPGGHHPAGKRRQHGCAHHPGGRRGHRDRGLRRHPGRGQPAEHHRDH